MTWATPSTPSTLGDGKLPPPSIKRELKSLNAADYLLEHGFCPPKGWKTAVSELTFEVDPEDRFYDDKMDILEFETYEQAPMDLSQSFIVVSEAGRLEASDPALVQFVRLANLGGSDAFMLESIFRKEVWGFMSLPVSKHNELLVAILY